MRGNNPKNRAWWPLLIGLLVLGGGGLLLLGWLGNVARAQGTNYALRFYGHGVNDLDRVKIKIDDPQVPADVGGDFTVEFWMQAEDADNQNIPFVACDTFLWVHGNIIIDRDIFDNPAPGGDFGISMYEGKIRFGTETASGGPQTICGGSRVDDGQWHHIVVTRKSSNGQMRIYVDGKQDAQGTGPSGTISYPNGRSGQPDDPYLVIGAEKHDIDKSEFPSYNGLIDELRISNNIRYAANFSPPSSPFTPDGNTMALYHFDEGPGNCSGIVTDSSGASGGPSNGTCEFGGSGTAGPVYTTDTPFGGSAPPATDTPVNPPTPTPDTTSPVISNTMASPLDTIASIKWDTDEPATSQVIYGISPTLTMTTTETTSYVTDHTVLLTGLIPDTTYVYQVHAKDVAGNPASSAELNFTTLAVEDVSHVYLPLLVK